MATAAGVTYTYDGDGKRVKKSNGTLYWYGPGGEVLAESNLSGTISWEYIYFNGQRVARRDPVSGTAHYYLADRLGSARMIAKISSSGVYQGVSVPYDRVNSLEYGQKAGRRVGVAIAVTPLALFSKKRKHYLTINWQDADDKQQAAVFELGKDVIRVTMSTLEARTGRQIEYQDEEARKSSKGN